MSANAEHVESTLLGQRTRDRVGVIGIALCVIALLLLPLVLVEIPPLLDYPNHLARMYVVAKGESDSYLSQMYGHHWLILPNLAIDLVMPAMLRVMPIYITGKIVLAFALVLPVVGTVLYARALHARWSAWSLGAALVAYNALFLLGFMNFAVGTGLATITAAFWIWQRDRRPALAIVGTTGLALLVFFFHIFGLGLLALLVGMHEIESAIRERTIRATLLRGLGVACVLLIPALLYLSSPLSDTSAAPVWPPSYKNKLGAMFLPTLNYDRWFDRGCLAAIVGFIAISLLRGWARISWATAGCIAILILLVLTAPITLKDTGFIADRFAVLYGFLLFAVILPDRVPIVVGRWVAVGFAVMFIVRIGIIATVWDRSRDDIAMIRDVIADVEPGSKVLVAQVSWSSNREYIDNMPRSRMVNHFFPTYWHLAALLPLEHDAFWPLMFASGNKQPVYVKPPYDKLSRRDGDLPDYQLLGRSERLNPVETDKYPYLPRWRDNFDYVMVMPAGGMIQSGTFPPSGLTLVRFNDMAALYRVQRPASP